MWDIRRSNRGYLDISGPLNRKELVPTLRRVPIESITHPDLEYPRQIFFDGNLIWVSTLYGRLFAINPTTNEIVTNSYHPDFQGCLKISCDGKFLWYTTIDSKLVLIDNSEYSVDAVIPLPDYAHDMVFDGQYMWLGCYNANRIEGWNTRNRTKEFEILMGNNNYPHSLVFDGRYIWVSVSDYSSRNIVKKINSYNRTVVAEINFDRTVYHLIFDGRNIWVYNGDSDFFLTIINPVTNSIEPYFDAPVDQGGSQDFLWDGSHIWWGNSSFNFLTKLDPIVYFSQERLDYYGVGRGARSLTFDGTHIWAVSLSNHTVNKIPAWPLKHLSAWSYPL